MAPEPAPAKPILGDRTTPNLPGPDLSSEALKAIGLMVAGALAMSLNNALLKWLSAGYPSGEVLFLRGVFIFPAIGLFVWMQRDVGSLRVNAWRDHIFRAGFTVVSAFFFVAAVRNLPLADVTAVTFAGPLFVTLLATPILGEKVGVRRWSAVIVGFIGVLVITRPGGHADWMLMLLPLGAALGAASRDVVTRRMTSAESSNAILVTTTTAVMLAGLCTAPFTPWTLPTIPDLGLMAACGFVSGIGHFCMIESLRRGEAALVSPFKYSSILWAVVMGYIFWGDLPDQWVVLGGAIVIASGLYILHREIVLRRQRRAARG